MARRSYLQRVAEPLRPGDAALSALPRPAPEEARPSVMRRVAAQVARSAIPATATGAVGADMAQSASTLGEPVATPDMPRDATRVEALAAFPASLPATPAEPPLRRAAPLSVGEHDGAMSTPRDAEPAIAAVFAPPAALPDAAVRPWAAASPPRSREQIETTAPTPRLSPRSRAPELSPAPQPPAASSPNDTSAPVARLHIGTLEVRSVPLPLPSAPSAPAPAASRAQIGPLARGYGWRFGLVQG